MFRLILSICFAITGLITYLLNLYTYIRQYNMLINQKIKVSKSIILNIENKEITTFIYKGRIMELKQITEKLFWSVIETNDCVLVVKRPFERIFEYDSKEAMPDKYN